MALRLQAEWHAERDDDASISEAIGIKEALTLILAGNGGVAGAMTIVTDLMLQHATSRAKICKCCIVSIRKREKLKRRSLFKLSRSAALAETN